MLVPIDSHGHQLEEKAAQDWLRLKHDAEAAGHIVVVNDAMRSLSVQKQLYSKYVGAIAAWVRAGSPEGQKPKPVAKPGTSEHGKGIAVDTPVAKQPAYRKWLQQNSTKYNFWFTALGEDWHVAHYGEGGPPSHLRARHDVNLKNWGLSP